MKNYKNEKFIIQTKHNWKENIHITKPEIQQRTLTKLDFKTCKNIECGNKDRMKIKICRWRNINLYEN